MPRILAKHLLACTVLVVFLPALALANCPPEGWSRKDLLTLKSRQFEIADNEQRLQLGEGLLACLDDPDPELRDGIAYEAYATWLRSDLIGADRIADWSRTLLARIETEAPDPAGIRRPFAALVLSELARTDRIKPHFTPELRARMAEVAVRYMTDCRDYRGFEPEIGWRHGVAHTADWIMQLSLNEQIPRGTLTQFQDALLSQVSAHGQYAYIDGESERLARAVLMLMHRTELTADSWVQVLARFDHPQSVPEWSGVFTSRQGLNERHNLRLFLYALDDGLRSSKLPDQQRYRDAVARLLKATAA